MPTDSYLGLPREQNAEAKASNERTPLDLSPEQRVLLRGLREAVTSGRGNYGHRLLCDNAAEEIEGMKRALDQRNEQIDGYERQLGIDNAGAERTIGSEIDRIQRENTQLVVLLQRAHSILSIREAALPTAKGRTLLEHIERFAKGPAPETTPNQNNGGDSLDHSGAPGPSDVRIVGTVSPLGSVTLTGEEFLALSTKEEQLTDALAHADAINGESVNRICALEATLTTERANSEATIARLASRVNRLRKRIGKAYDELAGASSEDAMDAADGSAPKTGADT